MKRLLAVVLVCGPFASVVFAKPPVVLSSAFTSDAGKYTVTFPVAPSKEDDAKTVTTAAGNLKVQTTRAETGGVIYSVTFTDYPESFELVKPKELLDGVVKGMAGDDGTVTQKDITLDDAPGRLVTISARQNKAKGRENEVRAKVFLQGRRLVIVMADGEREAMKGEAVDKFLGSFAWK